MKDFLTLAAERFSVRSFLPTHLPKEVIDRLLEAARLAPSACNGQPYHITVCRGEAAKSVAAAVGGMGMNKFAKDAPVMLVISEEPYCASAALGAKVKKNDYRSIDIGIVSAYITAAAAAEGIGSCILGWLDSRKIREICSIDGEVRLVITLGYATEDDELRKKKRKPLSELVSYVE